MLRITSFGAAGEVTGSQHLVETERLRLLLDCGLVQGRDPMLGLRNATCGFSPKKLDAVVLSHAHLDHCGKLPILMKAGFRGPILCSDATRDLAELMLTDSARIQEEDGERHWAGASSVLYTRDDIPATLDLFEPLPVDEWHHLFGDLRLRFRLAGHILGATLTELELDADRDPTSLIYTGDVGRRGSPLLPDPSTDFDSADVVICESTYGAQVHPAFETVEETLLELMQQIDATGGVLLVPAFSLGRTQQLLYLLGKLQRSGRLPNLPVAVDSPLAGRVTSVYERHRNMLSESVRAEMRDADPFDFTGLMRIMKRADSIALNSEPGPLVIISASGMCDGGRIRHHLRHRVGDPSTIILLMGYQAEGTTGRMLADGVKRLSFFDEEIEVKADVRTASGLSAHADARDLQWWFSELAFCGGAGTALLVHGEEHARRSLQPLIANETNDEVLLPEVGVPLEL